MHEGKALKKLVREDERKVQEISDMLGISRGYIYELYKQADIGEYFRKRAREAGIPLEKEMTPDDKRPANLNGLLTLNLAGGNLSVNDLILMSVEQLIKLQNEQEDGAAIKAIAQVVAYKQWAEAMKEKMELLQGQIDSLGDRNEGLKREIKLLQEKIDDLKKTKK